MANGWFQRAHRLLDELGPVGEQVWLALREAELSYHTAGDMAYTRELAAGARKLAADLELLDAEMMGLALEGLGEVDEGLRRLDEATVAAVGGELGSYKAVAAICCFMIFACERVRDIERASQWCEQYMAYCHRNDMPGYLAFCRARHASVLAARGRWAEAEVELERAREELQARPAWSLTVFERLGDLRRRQGRFDEAGALFERAQPHPGGIVGAGRLALDQGDLGTALELAEGMLDRVPEADRVERLAALELLVRARCARGEATVCEEAVAELEAVAEIAGSDWLTAMASHCRGQLVLAAGDADAATQPLQLALDGYLRARLPFESALVRLDLARAWQAVGRHESVVEQARTAGDSFEGLGATAETAKAGAVLRELSRTDDASTGGGLSSRETQVLRLLARGASNQEIADELVVSRHTVRRHVSNLLSKLGVASRTAAVAWAHEHDFV